MFVRTNNKQRKTRTLSDRRPPVQRMGMSVKCMIFHEGDVLLLQKKDREGLRPWEFPGGGLEFGEDLHDAALREVKEETGLAVELLDVAGLWSYRRSKLQFLTGVIFIAKATDRNVVLSNEHTDFAWVNPADFHKYLLQDSLRKALDRIQESSSRGQELRHYFVDNYRGHKE
ncbi:NUDIX hydrolase [Veillonella sp.]|uniref:NUDIX domain-containing protein n=1 Tax=Veillonella sp. TaxID=1926307 RepID=UPI0025D1477E|nr:NUDIX hydrolase [Veillonella sp.]